jgi:1-pyrroline-5-carboxylate dehydrogenase
LEGFVASISPFNFTAIGGNLGATPTLMGNVTLWKPSDTALLSNWNLYKIFKEAGVPDGVINFVPADGPTFGDTVTSSPHLAGINFTGSVRTFTHLTKQVGDNISAYNTYPKLVGECGGKNFHFVHKSADIRSVVTGTVRSAFEFGGQKCSACSRLYVPDTLWPKILEEMLAIHKQIKLGSAEDFSSYLSAVIDEKAFDRISTYLEMAENDSNLTVLAGGKADKSVGYFVEPTIVETKDPKHKIMQEEIFGPVLTVYVYPENQWEDCLHTINTTSPYGLTGSIFSQDRSVVRKAMSVLRHAAGNLYINDKSTGSVVGQQPFGGARASGTNDKAGSMFYLLRWVSPITIKETTVPLTEWTYPSVAPDN